MISDKIFELYNHYKKEMAAVGYAMRTPPATDFTKTYQYRHLLNFFKKTEELNLSTESAKSLITEIIKYAKEKKLLKRGIALLNKRDLFEICIKRIELNVKSCENEIQKLQSVVNLNLNAKQLIERHESSKTLANLTVWYMQGLIPELYIAFSRKCMSSLLELEKDEFQKQQLPSITRLIRIRERTRKNQHIMHLLKQLLRDDLIGV